MRVLATPALVSLALAGCGVGVANDPVREARAQTEVGRLLAGKVAGPTRSCISRFEAREQRIIDERTIVFSSGRNRLYRADIPGGCTGLDDHSTIIRRSPTGTLCSGEIFEVRDSGTQFTRGSCAFGDFTEYRTRR